jgi:putative membrane protein
MRSSNLALGAVAMTFAFGAAAQTRESAPENRSIVVAEASRASPTDNKNAEDIEFLVEAMRSSLAEVDLGMLAAERAVDPRVREYGTKVAQDHRAHAGKIRQMLEPLDVTVPEEPSADAQLHRAALARLAGQEFDGAFVETMIATHTEAIEQYGAQTHANPDQALSDLASSSLPMLREHLRTAESLR